MSAPCDAKMTMGVLALQGAFREHLQVLKRLGIAGREVRHECDLEGLDGIIFPGGESTAMALIGEKKGIFPALQSWVKSGKPVWGTCAGMILLSDSAVMQKEGGQALVGGMKVEVCRNFFGSQIDSFEEGLDMSVLNLDDASPYPAVFIRAPAIVFSDDPEVEILSTVRARPCPQARRAFRKLADDVLKSEGVSSSSSARLAVYEYLASENDENKHAVVVAARKGNLLATAFHPELTDDSRWHQYFVRIAEEWKAKINQE